MPFFGFLCFLPLAESEMILRSGPLINLPSCPPVRSLSESLALGQTGGIAPPANQAAEIA